MKLSTSQAAKLLKIHPDTLRKRAKAGKVPFTLNVLGHMQFDEKDLNPTVVVPPVAQLLFNTTKVLFVIDESGSMGGFTTHMDRALREQVDALRLASTPHNIFYASDIRFGSYVRPTTAPRMISEYNAAACRATDGSTCLYDGIGAALEYVKYDMTYDPGTAYLVVVITDGYENSSKKYNSSNLKQRIHDMNATGRVTVVVNCPPGNQQSLYNLGIHHDNVRAWEQTTKGVERFATANTQSISTYAQVRGTGQSVSMSYYANVGPDQDKVAANLGSLLEDVTKEVDAQRVAATGAVPTVKSFAVQKFGGFTKGQIFYELTKNEKVQQYKKILVQDQKTGKFYRGWDKARQLLGLPAFQNGEIKVKPGTLGDFKVFVQSTSVNRKLVPGTTVVKLA